MAKSYHFSLGNSTTGPVGLCARVIADSPEETVEILRETLPAIIEVPWLKDDKIEYVAFYTNVEAITVEDIDDDEDEDEGDGGENGCPHCDDPDCTFEDGICSTCLARDDDEDEDG